MRTSGRPHCRPDVPSLGYGVWRRMVAELVDDPSSVEPTAHASPLGSALTPFSSESPDPVGVDTAVQPEALRCNVIARSIGTDPLVSRPSRTTEPSA